MGGCSSAMDPDAGLAGMKRLAWRRGGARLCGVLLAAALAACGREAPQGGAAAPADDIAALEARQSAPVDSAARIGPEGIGAARAGMTIGALRRALPAGTTLGAPEAYMVDVQGLPVVRGADTLYHVLVVAGEPSGDEAPITLVATRNSAFRTAEGIGPGSTIREAAEHYGAATLSSSTSDESREYVAFARYPHPNVRFRAAPPQGREGMAGSYSTEGEFNETTQYDPAARILQVMVELRRPGTE